MKVTKLSLSLVFLLVGLVARAQVTQQDSLALVALYNATGGPNWTNNTNWLQPGQNVSTWYGVGLSGNRVANIALGDNNLTGQIPAQIGDLFELGFLDLESNHLSGVIPSSLNNIDKLLYIILSNNEYTGQIPAFLVEVPIPAVGGYRRQILLDNNNFSEVEGWTNFRNVQWLSIENNRLDFQDIESFLNESIPVFTYEPQKPIYTEDEITLREGATLILKTTTGGSANHYQWFKDNAVMTDATAENLTLNITPANEGEYFARVTNDHATDLTLERAPIALNVKDDTVYISCEGLPITLNAAVSDPQATYRWNTGTTTASLEVSASGKYGVQVETGNYILKDTLNVIIFPKLSLGPDADLCAVSLTLSSNVSGAGSYEWSTPAGTINNQSSITAAANGAYILTVTHEGCMQKDTVNVILNHFTPGDFTVTAGNTAVDETRPVLLNAPLIFTNATGTGSGFTWSFGDGQTSSEENPVHTYEQAGEYQVTLSGTDSRNCPITIEKSLKAQDILITNAISPNGDGLNDKLYIEPFLYSAELTVVNRWGQEVYKTSSYNNDFTGQNLESGVYYYELNFKEIDKSYKGYFHIMK